MKMIKRGFLLEKNSKIKINHKKTNSILLNKLHVDLLLRNQQYMTGNLLDAGCGEKPYSLIYDKLVQKSIGVDVEYCIHDQAAVDIFATLDHLPFKDETFDTILSTSVMEHVAESVKGFSELARVLKKDGYMIVSVPFLYPLHEAPNDFYRYSINGIKYQLERNKLELISITPWGGVGMMFLVYLNMFFCKFLNVSFIRSLGCIMQEFEYMVYRNVSLKKLINNKNKMAETISLGYFVIAKKHHQ